MPLRRTPLRRPLLSGLLPVLLCCLHSPALGRTAGPDLERAAPPVALSARAPRDKVALVIGAPPGHTTGGAERASRDGRAFGAFLTGAWHFSSSNVTLLAAPSGAPGNPAPDAPTAAHVRAALRQ